MKIKIILVVFILFLGIILRFNNYAVYPQRGATSDEYTYSFLGVSLLTEHKPVSWSFFGEYTNKKDLTIKKIYFPLVYPYFDHPPFYGLLVGGWSILFGQDTFTKIDLATIRLMPIILSFISSILVFLIGKRLYGYKTAVWALLIYSTTTFFIMNMRVVVSENLLTTLLLTALYIFSETEKLSQKKVILIGILCGLSLLTKIAGIVVFFSIFYLFISHHLGIKKIMILSFVFLFFVLLLFGYASYYDWNLFWEIQKAQGSRFIGPETLWLLTTSSVIVNKVIFDGWYFFGLFAIFYSFSDYVKNKIIIIPSIIYFLILLLSLTKQGSSGWYLIPLFPFMALSIAQVLQESLKKQNFIFLLFIIFIGMTQMKYLYEPAFGLTSSQFRLFTLILAIPVFLTFLFKNDKWRKISGNFWFYTFILGNIIMTISYMHPS